jgi:hypothetical protein
MAVSDDGKLDILAIQLAKFAEAFLPFVGRDYKLPKNSSALE